jgi:cyclase
MKRAFLLAAAVGIIIVAIVFGVRTWWTHRARPLSQEPQAEHPPVGAIYQVATNLYVVPGGGGNTAVFIATSGVVLVDTKYAERYQALVDQVRTVTDKPITLVINTHCHGDHTGGNTLLPPGVEIVVQERTARNMDRINRSLGVSPVPGRTIRTYKDRLTLLGGDDAIDLYYFGPAHTDGDTFVVFRAAGVMHAGDVFPGKAAPVINTPFGGSGLTYGETIGKAATVTGVRQVISGHGPVFTWNDFVDYGEFNRLLLEQARSSRRSGKLPFQAVKELVLPDKFKDYKLGRLNNTFDEIYRGLTPWWHVW